MKLFYTFVIPLFTASLSIAQQSNNHNSILTPSVHCDTVIQTSTCAGGNVIVPFTVSGGNFSFGNIFTAQLSNAFGQFTAPVNIGSLTWFTSGLIYATLPQNVTLSIFYRIRVIATNPADTSNTSPNPIIITTIPQLNTIVANPNQNYICPGDSLTLFALNPSTSYSWSTGDTTASIVIHGPGIYTVATTLLTCQTTTSDTIYLSCTGVYENVLQHSLNIFPNPAHDHITIQLKTGNPIDANITLTNPLGEVLLRTNLKLGSEKELDVSSVDTGIYFLTIESNGERFTQKVIVR